MKKKFYTPILMASVLLGGAIAVTSCNNTPSQDVINILYGQGKPESSVGSNGQTYIDIDNADKYVKNGDSWLLVAPTRLSGEGAPASDLGNPGDEYEDTITKIIYRKFSETEWRIFKRPEVVLTHQVTFDLNGGMYGKDIAIPAQEVEDGKIATEPIEELINKPNCTFDGWYDGRSLWNFHTPVYSDLHLVAKYNVNEDQKITFTVDPANGENPYEVTSFRGETPRIANPTKDGYDFIGWFIDGGSVQYPGYVNEELKGKTLVAKYEKAKFNFKYAVTPEGEIEITGLHNIDTVNVIIPDTLDGKPVTKISKTAFSSRVKITQIYLGKNVREVDPRGFLGCRALNKIDVDPANPNLTTLKGALYSKDLSILYVVPTKYSDRSLTLPNTLKTIYSYACYGQGYEGINNIEFNKGLETIMDHAFSNCDGLTTLTFPASLKTIGEGAFSSYYEGSIQKIVWQNGLEEIGDYAFSGQYLKDDITFPDTVKKIGSGAFNDNKSVKTVNLPRDLETLVGNPFINCFALRNLTISKANPNFMVENNVLYSKDGSKLVLVPDQMYQSNFIWGDNVKVIGKEAFYSCDEFDTIEIPNTVTTIEERGFFNCFGTSSITIPDSVETIGKEAFGNCSALVSLKIGTGLKSIPVYAFENCSSLTDITIPGNVKSIGDQAFFGCNSLTNLVLEEGVETIGTMAFKFVPPFSEDVPVSSDSRLLKLRLPDTLTSIGDWAFDGHNKLNELYIGKGLKTISRVSFDETAPLGDISGLTKNPYLNLDNNIVYSEDFKTLYFANSNVSKDIVLHTGIETIAPYAFARIPMTDVIFPDSVKSIGEGAFYATNISELALPAELLTIGEGAFWSADNLSTVTWNEKLESIGDSAFAFNKIASIEFPNTLKHIGNEAFGLSSELTTVKFGNNLEYLGDHAFKFNDKLAGDINLPASLTYFGKGAFFKNDLLNSSKITSINIDPLSKTYESKDGMVLTKDGKTLVAYAPSYEATTLVIPETVETIADYGLAEAYKLTSLTLPSNLKTIGEYGLAYLQNVETFNIPASVEYINDRAFYGTKIGTVFNFNCTLKYARTHFHEGYLNGVNTSEVIINYKAEESDENAK